MKPKSPKSGMTTQDWIATCLIVMLVMLFVGVMFLGDISKTLRDSNDPSITGDHKHIVLDLPDRGEIVFPVQSFHIDPNDPTKADKDHDPLNFDARLRAIDLEAFNNLATWRASNFEAHFSPAMWERMTSLLWQEKAMAHEDEIYWGNKVRERNNVTCSNLKNWAELTCESHNVYGDPK